jgi:hypothetical protein
LDLVLEVLLGILGDMGEKKTREGFFEDLRLVY